MIDTYNSLLLIFLKFYGNHCPDYFNEVFCPVDDNGVDKCCCNKKLKLLYLFVSQVKNAKFFEHRAYCLEQTPQ